MIRSNLCHLFLLCFLFVVPPDILLPIMNVPDAAEQNIQMWKVKKLIKSLDSARGFVTTDLEKSIDSVS